LIQEATTEAEISATFPVMRQLRPHLSEDEYLGLVNCMQRSGYRLATATENGEVRCAAGFRIVEFLAWGRFLYVDDFVTTEDARSLRAASTRLRGTEARCPQVLLSGRDEDLQLSLLEGAVERLAPGILLERGSG
jgi:hypothetical protein